MVAFHLQATENDENDDGAIVVWDAVLVKRDGEETEIMSLSAFYQTYPGRGAYGIPTNAATIKKFGNLFNADDWKALYRSVPRP